MSIMTYTDDKLYKSLIDVARRQIKSLGEYDKEGILNHAQVYDYHRGVLMGLWSVAVRCLDYKDWKQFCDDANEIIKEAGYEYRI